MMQFLYNLQPWHWLSFGIFMLLLEILGAGGFLLGVAAGALSVSALAALFPGLAWTWELILFALLSIIFTLIYWKKFRGFNEATEQPLLNSRVQALVGRSVPLFIAIEHGTGKVQIEDALWTVSCGQDLPAGAIVTVTGAEGMTLLVKPQAG